MEKNIKIVKIKGSLTRKEMEYCNFDDNMEDNKDNIRRNMVMGLIITYFIIAFIPILDNFYGGVTMIIIIVIIWSIIFIYKKLIVKRVIKPFYNNLYKNGFYISGYVELDDNKRLCIQDCILNKNDLDMVIESEINAYKENWDYE